MTIISKLSLFLKENEWQFFFPRNNFHNSNPLANRDPTLFTIGAENQMESAGPADRCLTDSKLEGGHGQADQCLAGLPDCLWRGWWWSMGVGRIGVG